ncbi:aldo/keto reductase [Paenibacillus sp. IB182496]|uniref:Aldo/keto reductase n=1 Tax=Paenibacillus sabuli TaxID=2772509 RepID=A0A927BX93_9BACL|nr:aldo/keto reductase [Paenibacillus sabuli]MBD2847415.1 aldo/keto reductase [Paenibacillus sabuli]
MEYTVLRKSGLKVSRLGLGGAPFGSGFGPMDDEAAVRTIHAAIDAGVTFLDTAPAYGDSELRYGKALAGGKRSQIVLATKAVRRGEAYSHANTLASVERSLQRLGTDWIDLIQLHEAETTTFEEGLHGTLEAFARLKEQGKVRAIGVNARRLSILKPYIETGLLDTVQIYCKYTLIDYEAVDELFPLAREHNVQVINGSPLCMGILADHPASFMNKDPQLLAEAEGRVRQLDFLRHSEPYGLVEPAMRFSLSCDDIAVSLSGSTSPEMIRGNAAYCDGRGLQEEDQRRVLSLFAGQPLWR